MSILASHSAIKGQGDCVKMQQFHDHRVGHPEIAYLYLFSNAARLVFFF